MTSPVEEIKSRIDIVELVGGYVRLQRGGANFKALCPFHKEKTPSFNVSPTRQIWHCFGGCSEGGDIFKFIMKIEGLDFPEALRLLAKRAGVELRREDPRVRSERNRLYDLLEEAAGYFQKNLDAVPSVKAYLAHRKVSEKTISDFRIGFSFDSWDGLLKYLLKKGYNEAEAGKAGLAVKGESGSWYDRFRSRIMFPIADSSGRIVGFGGRILESATIAGAASVNAAKYINTPETPLYNKSRALYAFDKAKESIRKANSCVIVEGYMDALMSHQAGLANAVAVSGTALTAEQLKSIRRLAETLISSFDRDSAGEAATKRSLDLAAEFDFERKVALLPPGIKDPADAVLSAPSIWHKAVDEALPIVEFYFKSAVSKHNPETAHGAKAIAGEVLPEIRKLRNEVERAYWVRKLSQAVGVSEESVWQELTKKSSPAANRAYSRDEGGEETFLAKTRREHLEELSLGVLAVFPGVNPEDSGMSEEFFARDAHRILFKKIKTEKASASLPLELRDYLNHLAFKAEVFLEPVEEKDGEVRLIFRELHSEHLKHKREALTRQITEAEKAGNEPLLASLTAEYKALCDKLHKLSAK